MATPWLIGAGAVGAALIGRQIYLRSAAKKAQEWAVGGFKARMDRKEAFAVLGLK
jgi:DnaJ homolog subfamily C member 19